MFLIVYEDGALQKTNNLTDDIYDGLDQGVIDVVDMETGQVYDIQQGEWLNIDEV